MPVAVEHFRPVASVWNAAVRGLEADDAGEGSGAPHGDCDVAAIPMGVSVS
jgi:hypothetical protein